VITALITDRPLCLECIAKASFISLEAVKTALTVIQRALEVHRQDTARCRACGEARIVFSVDRPPSD